MAKNRFSNNTEEVKEPVTQPELIEVIGEDGMVDMTANTDSTIDEVADVEDINQQDTSDVVGQQLDALNIPTDENDTQEEESEKELPEIKSEDLAKDIPEKIKEPEVKQEPIVEPETKTEVVSLGADIKVLNDSSVSIEDKIKWCLTEAPNVVRSLANQLLSYNDTMKPSAIYNEQAMVNKQYELVSIYRSIFNVLEYKDFKVKFDVLNLFFAYYKDEAFAAQRLCRFDYLWKWSEVELTTLLHVSEVVSQLCIYAERVKRLKQLNLDMALDSTKTIVTEEARNNIIRYYKI